MPKIKDLKLWPSNGSNYLSEKCNPLVYEPFNNGFSPLLIFVGCLKSLQIYL